MPMPTGPQRPAARPYRGPAASRSWEPADSPSWEPADIPSWEPADSRSGAPGGAPAGEAPAGNALPDLHFGEWLDRAAGPGRPQLRARATAAAMLGVFLAGCLAAGWLHAGALPGLSFLAGAAAGAWYCRRTALLRVVVIPPALFLLAVLAEQVVTAPGGSAMTTAESVLAGTFLMLSANAPWLFCGMVAAVGVAWRRGLRQCARELRAELTGNPARQAAR